MKRRYVFNALIAVLAIAVLVSMAFSYVVIRPSAFSGVEKILLDYLVSGVGSSDGQLSFSAVSMIRGAFLTGSAAELIESDLLNSLVFQLKIVLIFPYVAAVPVLVFGVLRPRWTYFVTAALSLITSAVLLLYSFLYLPGRMVAILDDVLSGANIRLTFNLLLGSGGTGSFRTMIWKCLSFGYWAILICSALCVILSLTAFFVTGEKKASRGTASSSESRDEGGQNAEENAVISDGGYADRDGAGNTEPAVFCKCGELSGAEIPVAPGEEMKIGQNPALCNLIITAEGVEGLHCIIRFRQEEQVYAAASFGMTRVEGYGELGNGQMAYVKRGGQISLGRAENILILE